MKKTGKSGLIILAALAMAAGTSQANLVLNASFETNTLAPGVYENAGSGDGRSYGNVVTSWTQGGTLGNWYEWTQNPTPSGGITGDYVVVPKDGDKYMSLVVYYGGYGAVYQPLTLTGGTEYSVSFWEVNRTSGTAGLTAGFYSDTGLTTPVSSVITANATQTATPTAPGWTQYSFTYTPASSGTTYLGFKAVAGSFNGGANLDNVSVTAIPEPASGLLLFASAAGLGWLRRKLRG